MRVLDLSRELDTNISSLLVVCKFHCYAKLFDCIIYWWKFLICYSISYFYINIEKTLSVQRTGSGT